MWIKSVVWKVQQQIKILDLEEFILACFTPFPYSNTSDPDYQLHKDLLMSHNDYSGMERKKNCIK